MTGPLTSGVAAGGVFGLCNAECATRTLLEHPWPYAVTAGWPPVWPVGTGLGLEGARRVVLQIRRDSGRRCGLL